VRESDQGSLVNEVEAWFIAALRAPAISEASPCDDCRFTQRCVDERLACAALSLAASGAAIKRWANAPRAPSRVTFEIIAERSGPRSRRTA
jgi:hypothetical protein